MQSLNQTEFIEDIKLLISCLDLTSLNDEDTEETILKLCADAITPAGTVAAVCVYPKFVSLAKAALLNSPIKIASVANFPQGSADITHTVAQIQESIEAGADEIDVVMPYYLILYNDFEKARQYLRTCKTTCGSKILMKVIIESGELKTTENIRFASQIAIEAGADFIKTSTGKVRVNATPEAAQIMLEVIRESGKPVGFKASGGIKTADIAEQYLRYAKEIMGEDWVSPNTFRIGASSLLFDLINQL